jgi:ABC-type antimicrobial peptide transport system permease subunit
VLLGTIGSLPIILYLHNNPIHITGAGAKTFDQLAIEPIFNFSIESGIFISQAFVVFLIAFATILYPILFIRKLEPINALHG